MRALFFLVLLLGCQHNSSPPVYDTIIVGAGAAGTYCAWRLKNAKSNEKITLIEWGDRVGGRLHSVESSLMPGVIAELGGMRLLRSHTSTFSLIEHLGLHTELFDRGETGKNPFYFRNTRFQKNNLKAAPYNLLPEEKGKDPHDLMLYAIHKAIPEIESLSPIERREYLKTALYQSVPLWQTGFWNLLLQQLSADAFHFLSEVSGYHTDVSNWNAYDAIIAFSKYVVDDPFYRVKEGFESLPKRLAEKFLGLGGEIKLKTRVTALQKKGTLLEITCEEGGKSHTLLAKNVILALPRRSIELLGDHCFLFDNPAFSEDLERVEPEYASKIFLWFDQEFWTSMGLSSGPARTDLPIRQCFYFNTEKNKGLLMASYSDQQAVSFWQGYFPQGAFGPSRENTPMPVEEQVPPERMTAEIVRELERLHGISIPNPTYALYQNWANDPYGAAWHYWNPSNQSWLVIPRIRKPDLSTSVYICGEAYSSHQGWVEGAINTAEKLLEDHFGLSRPIWLDPAYDLGP